MDARGHGSSDKPQTEAAHGAAMVEDVIALKTAVLHLERVQGLLLCGMGWLQEGGIQQKFWQLTQNPCSSVLPGWL